MGKDCFKIVIIDMSTILTEKLRDEGISEPQLASRRNELSIFA